MSAQTQHYVAVSTDSLRVLAQRLKEDLQNGSIVLADLHAIQLRLAVLGVLREDMASKIGILEQSEPKEGQPEVTADLVPLGEKLLQELNEPNLGLAKRYAEQLAAQVHKAHEAYNRTEANSAKTEDAEYDKYFDLSRQLGDALRAGDVAKAVVLSVDVLSTENAFGAKKKWLPLSTHSRNVYDINDALGREAFLRKDYFAAGDYLLKAADGPGKDPSLITFGPDLWLANALTAAGFKDVVLTFLGRCKAFWPNPRLDEWISVLQNGGSPNFSKNIFSKDPILSR
jgi:hypothetical protein